MVGSNDSTTLTAAIAEETGAVDEAPVGGSCFELLEEEEKGEKMQEPTAVVVTPSTTTTTVKNKKGKATTSATKATRTKRKKIDIDFIGKAALMKELQRTAAFRAYCDSLAEGDSSNATKLENEVFARYFGYKPGAEPDPDSVGYAQQLVNGENLFSNMYHRIDELFDDGADGGEVCLVLKKIYHCMQNENVYSSNDPAHRGINMAVLCSKTLSDRSHLTPRKIWDSAKLVETNGKKALAIYKRSEYGKGDMPSGKTYEEFLVFIRKAMFNELKGGSGDDDDDIEDDNRQEDDPLPPVDAHPPPPVVDAPSEQEDNDVDEDNEAPTAGNNKEEPHFPYFFPGFISFALWGPILPDNRAETAGPFLSTDKTNTAKRKPDKEDGRSATRTARQKKNNDPAVSSSLSSYASGVAQGVVLARTPAEEEDDKLFACYMRQQATNKRLKVFEARVQNCQDQVDILKALLVPGAGPETNQKTIENLRNAIRSHDAALMAMDDFLQSEESHYMHVLEETLNPAPSLSLPSSTEESVAPPSLSFPSPDEANAENGISPLSK